MDQSRKGKVKLVITGGHAATTALSVIQELKARKKNWNIYFFGSKYAIEGHKIYTLEYEMFTNFGTHFVPITAGRLQRTFTIHTLPSLFRIPLGFIQAFLNLTRIRPDVVLSFGGYTAFPVVVASWLLKVPIVLHEQTVSVGRANLLAQKFASKIAVSRPESRVFFPNSKTVVTGNPLTKEILKVGPKKGLGNPVTIFVTGGSRGSRSINNVIREVLPFLLSKYRVVHQTGELDFRHFADLKKVMGKKLGVNYEVFSRIKPEEISEVYRRSDMIIARSGANTVSEIIATKRPAILIPLPISYREEQTQNALFAKRLGVAEVIVQSELSSKTLMEAIYSIIRNYDRIINNLNFDSPDTKASSKLVDIVVSIVE